MFKKWLSSIFFVAVISGCGLGTANVESFDYEINALDQTLSVDREVSIKSVRSDRPILVVIFASGILGNKQVDFENPLGFVYLASGTNQDTAVILDRSLHNGEALHAFMYEDLNGNKHFDNGVDSLLRDRETRTFNTAFRVSKDANTANVHLKVNVTGTSYNWRIISGGDDSVKIEQGENATVELKTGIRYFVENENRTEHPIQLVGGGSVLLAEGDNNAAFSSISDVNVENNNALSFTLTDQLAQQLESYQCRFHSNMKGSIVIK